MHRLVDHPLQDQSDLQDTGYRVSFDRFIVDH
jgi:hypothetical protein